MESNTLVLVSLGPLLYGLIGYNVWDMCADSCVHLFIFTTTYQAPCPLHPEFINVHVLIVNEISMSATFVLLMKPDWPI